jgi:molybdopterin molybdotransferase
MVTVQEAEAIIQSQTKDYGTELVSYEHALGRVLAEDLKADRDLPPCNRVTMDGIAVNYSAFEQGAKSFTVKATIAAGDVPVEIENTNQCVEIMTGAALPDSTDTIIRYEDVEIKNGSAAITTETIKKGQNIHRKGRDKKQGDVVAVANQVIDATVISMAASVGVDQLPVKKLPRVVIISTGDELVEVSATPTPYQIRQSNNHTVKAALQQYGINAALLHLPDEPGVTKEKIKECIDKYDVLILSGGVSMGKFDYVPQVLEELSVEKHFHKVQQRPGKPFWFGTHGSGVCVFAFPGNPVSTFMCLYRYFIPWLTYKSKVESRKSKVWAVLDKDVAFPAPLQYFMQVKVGVNESGQVVATPVEGNGSGDFANLLESDAFMELPMERSNFMKGQVFPIWPFKRVI